MIRSVFVTVLCLGAMIACRHSALAADPSPGDDAIEDAIKLLEARLEKITDKSEADKVSLAIKKLKEFVGAAPASSGVIDIADLIDNTEKYKGKELKLEMTLDSPIFADQGQSLRDFVGSEVKFRGRGPKQATLNLVIQIPAGLDVPKAHYGDKLVVTFACKSGLLDRDNEAKSIVRPK